MEKVAHIDVRIEAGKGKGGQLYSGEMHGTAQVLLFLLQLDSVTFK